MKLCTYLMNSTKKEYIIIGIWMDIIKAYYMIRGMGSTVGFAHGARRAPIEWTCENVFIKVPTDGFIYG